MAKENYATIRDAIGHYIGRTIVEITQHDKEEFEETGVSYVELMFDNGKTLKFLMGDDTGFIFDDVDGQDFPDKIEL